MLRRYICGEHPSRGGSGNNERNPSDPLVLWNIIAMGCRDIIHSVIITVYRSMDVFYVVLICLSGQGPYSRTSYDISQAWDWSRWPSRPVRGLRYVVTCTRIQALAGMRTSDPGQEKHLV